MNGLIDTKYFKAISKLGFLDIQALINPSLFEIINHQNVLSDKKYFAQIILDLYSVEDILLNKEKRNILFDVFQESELNNFLKELEVSSNKKDAWSKLKGMNFTSDKQREKLFEFFELTYNQDYKVKEEDLNNIACESLIPEYSLFPHQEDALKELSYILKKSNRVLLHMPTGSGKTRTAMNFICSYLRDNSIKRNESLVVWLADTEELCEQAYNEFKKAWSLLGISPINLFRFYSNFNLDLNQINSGLLITSLAKLRNYLDDNEQLKSTLDFSRKCSLIIFDEAHKIIAPTYSRIVELILCVSNNCKLIGLSATPGRSTIKHDENSKLAEFFEKKKVTLKVDGYNSPIEFLQKEKYIANISYHYIDHNDTLSEQEIKEIESSDEFSYKILQKLSLDSQRNLKLVHLIKGLYEEGKKILVFACSLEHAQGLYTFLKYHNVNSGFISSKLSNDIRNSTIERFRQNEIKVLLNYGVLTTGFDDPQVNVAVIARPTKSLTLYSQMVGRAIRGEKVGGQNEAEIYTVLDSSLTSFNDLTRSFDFWENSWKEEVLT